MDTIKLNHIEELLNTLLAVIQQELQNNNSYGIVTQKELLQVLKISPHFSQSQSISPQISTYQIPTLKSALDLIAGQTPLLIELKSELFTNHHLFCQKTALILQEYQKQNRDAFVAIKSFDPRIIRWFKYHFPEIPAGLLISGHPKALLLLGLLALNFP